MNTKVLRNLEEGILALLLASMTVITFMQVVLRYVFAGGVPWALEATSYLFGWLVLIGISYGIRVNAHIGVDAFVRLLPPGGQWIAGVLASGLCLAYAVLMTLGAWNYWERIYALGVYAQDIPVPRWVLVSILPLGFALLGLRLLQVAIGIITGKRSALLLADEAADALKTEVHPDAATLDERDGR